MTDDLYDENFDILVKLLLVGDSGVGKSSLLMRFTSDTFTPNFLSTIGIDFKIKKIPMDDKLVKLQVKHKKSNMKKNNFLTITFLDLGYCRPRKISYNHNSILQGKIRNSIGNKIYFLKKGAQGIIIVYDVTSESSFENIKNWLQNIEKHAPSGVKRLLIGNKSDLEDKKKISTEAGKTLARELDIGFFEVSAKTGKGVNEAFEFLGKQVKNMIVEQNMVNEKREGGGSMLGNLKRVDSDELRQMNKSKCSNCKT